MADQITGSLSWWSAGTVWPVQQHPDSAGGPSQRGSLQTEDGTGRTAATASGEGRE